MKLIDLIMNYLKYSYYSIRINTILYSNIRMWYNIKKQNILMEMLLNLKKYKIVSVFCFVFKILKMNNMKHWKKSVPKEV